MTGLDAAVRENGTVIVSCTVARLYPALKIPADFTLTWGQDAPISATQTDNGDGKTFSYFVQVQKTVNREDDGKDVTCSIMPAIGRPVVVTKRFNLLGEYYFGDFVTSLVFDISPQTNIPPPSQIH